MNKNLLTSILLCLLSANVMAADLSSIEEQERAQIIKELTFGLETKQNCTQTLNWDDSGSGADLDGYFFLPKVGQSEYIIGGHASGKRSSKYHCVTTVSLRANNPKGSPAILVKPADWKQVWKDSGSGATKDGSFWQAIPPDSNYKCIGSVSQLIHNQKPNLPNYRCVHTSLTDKITSTAVVWSDKGTGADQQVTMFNLPVTGSYFAIGSRANQVETYDLKKNASSVPDPKMVEKILAERMAPLKAGIAEKTSAIKKQKEEAKKATAKKAAAKKEKQKKITAAAEKKALAAQAESEEDNNSVEEAERLKEQQQARIEKAMQEKEAALLQEESKVEENKEEVQVETVIEETAQIVEETEPSDESIDKPKSESKGLSSIMSFFLKVLGILVGGLIVLMIAFKVLFGKKEK